MVGRAVGLHETEVEHFHEVVDESQSSDMDVGGLDVPMHQGRARAPFQRCAHLTENVNHPTRRQGTDRRTNESRFRPSSSSMTKYSVWSSVTPKS